jgi:GTPase SAR1 family protein
MFTSISVGMNSPPGGSSSASSGIDKVRVLVLGDAGVGKTSLIHLITEDEVCNNPHSTVGCFAAVKLHEYNDKPYFIEFLEVGGKLKYEASRNIFYGQPNGMYIYLVTDACRTHISS